MKRILVTGGAGFIGSHLCERLLCEGHEVICLDNCYTGNKNNIRHLFQYHGFKFIQHDITSPYYEAVDEIYNLACPASPFHYLQNPIETLKTSIYGAFNMLELALQTKSKILQTSTSEVYGDPIVHPQIESYWGNVNPVGIRACYDEGKRAAETLFMDYYRYKNVKIKIVRIFNTYGPNMNINDGRVVSNFIIQALSNKDITIYGSGMQTRSFMYVDDLIEGIWSMMKTDESLPGPINLGNPCEISILQLAQKVIELTCSKSKIVFHPLPSDDPERRKPNITYAKENLNGWTPKVKLEEGLQNTIKYFCNVLDKNRKETCTIII